MGCRSAKTRGFMGACKAANGNGCRAMERPLSYRYPISVAKIMNDILSRLFFAGFIRLHILHHAAEAPICGVWIVSELGHHGYRLSPGTLYPMLARMVERGWLRATEPKRATAARMYRLTPRGHEVLRQVLEALDELYREVGGHRPKAPSKTVRSSRSAPKAATRR